MLAGIMEHRRPQSKNYQCVTCLKCFSAPSKLQRHILSHTGQRPFVCHLCEKAFRQLAHLKFHINTHLYPKHIERKSNVKSSLLPSGYENAPPIKIDNSNACLQTGSLDTFGAEGTLEVGISPTAPVDRVEEKSLCSSRCTAELNPQHSAVERFEKQHTKDEPMRNHDDWSEPEKQTLHEDRSSRDETVDKHTKIIENSNSHKCPECFKCFSAPSKLKRHCLIHTGQKPFQCYLCRRAFRQLAHLKVHYSIHSGVAKSRNSSLPRQSLKSISQPQRSKTWPRNYPCNMCGRRFKQKRHLIVHQQTHKVSETAVHPRKLNNISKAYLPPQSNCASKVYFQNSESSITYNIEANGKRQLDVVEGLYNLSEILHDGAKHASQEHIDLTRSPDNRNKSPVSNRTDHTHTSTRKARENQCMICLKKFDYPSKLSRHLLVHMGIKPFGCTVCSKSFRQLCHLQTHMKAHYIKSDNVSKRVEDTPDQPGDIIFKNKPVSAVKRNQSEHLDQVSQPREASRGLNEVDCFLSQYVLPVRPTFSHCSTDSLSNYGAQQPAWNPSEKLLPGLDTDTDRKSSAEPVSLRQGHKTDYKKTSDVFDSTPTHHSLIGKSKQRSCILQKKPTIHGRGRYCCPVCSKRFDAPSKLQRHSLVHTGQSSYQCPTCPKTFRQKVHMKVHQSVHEQGKEAKPSISHNEDRQTKSLSRLKRTPCSNGKDVVIHNRSENTLSSGSDLSAVPLVQFNCPPTNDVDSQTLLSVAPRKSGVYQCMACLKKFNCPSKLSRHLLVHMGIKPFRCTICSKSFRQLCHLQSHAKVHYNKATLHGDEQQRNINLAQLDNIPLEDGTVSEGHIFAGGLHQDEPGPSQSFGNYKQNSNYRQNGHGGESYNHFCLITESANQSTEINRKHEPTPNPEQSEDVKSMKSENNWSIAEEKEVEKFPSHEYYGQQNHPQLPNWLSPYPYHQETTKNKQAYPIANQHVSYLEDRPNLQYGAKEEDGLEGGLRSEFNVPYKSEPPNDLHVCAGCSQCFTTKRKLNHHRCSQRHLEKERRASSYQCAICFKSFEAPSKLKRHYVIHTGQRPFQCTVCGKAFTQASHLKTHLQTHR